MAQKIVDVGTNARLVEVIEGQLLEAQAADFATEERQLV